jgi:hypothetical protein
LALKVVQQRLDNIQRVPKAICEIWATRSFFAYFPGGAMTFFLKYI